MFMLSCNAAARQKFRRREGENTVENRRVYQQMLFEANGAAVSSGVGIMEHGGPPGHGRASLGYRNRTATGGPAATRVTQYGQDPAGRLGTPSGATRRAIDSGWAAWYSWSDSTEPDGRHPDSWPRHRPTTSHQGRSYAHIPAAPDCRGGKAPDFALNGVDGKPVKLSDLTAKGPVVIYTFIAAFTPT
jgi:hypothetical protein